MYLKSQSACARSKSRGGITLGATFKIGAMATAAIVIMAFGGTRCAPHNSAAASVVSVNKTHLQSAAYKGSITTVWLYDEYGDPTEAPTFSYVAGHIYDEDDALVATVPDPATDGHAFDSSNHDVGFIDPSPAASNELPGG